ncbi:MAG: hypothetical protein FH762_10095 [Firmicutes bacterium]|nr:hypothetical protein [Bacillota bacterium]
MKLSKGSKAIRSVAVISIVITVMIVAGFRSNAEVKKEIELSLVESDGTKVVFHKVPERIVVISYGTAIIMDALGIDPVGIATTNRKLPEGLKGVTQVGIPMSPNMEEILQLRPDLVILSSIFKAAQKKKFDDHGIVTYFIDNQRYTDTIASVMMLGEFFAKRDEAEKIVANIKTREEKVLKRVEGKTPPRVLIIFGTTQSFQMATRNSYCGYMVEMLGGINIAGEIIDSANSYLPLSIENVVQQNPDIILRITHGNWNMVEDSFKKEFDQNELWNTVKAVKNKRVYDLDANLFQANPGLEIIDALEYLGDILYQ